tara:strand:+ start:225 stop:521 length:297 start_codon:yes stop_codon:yes gene_type:complete
MATQTQTSGAAGRTLTRKVSGQAKFDTLISVSAADVFTTGSRAGTKGFIIQTAGNTVITPVKGTGFAASILNTKEVYEIATSRVSGSGVVHLLYNNNE